MPRHVDHDRRRAEIVRVTVDLLAEGGVAAVNFRTIAEKLGGSTTIVTHYYGTREELLNDIVQRSTEGWHTELATLEKAATTPAERLAILLVWLLPTTRSGLREERARINLLSSQLVGPSPRRAFTGWDDTIRQILHDHVEQLVTRSRVDAVVESLRVTTNGIVLSAVERPSKWPKERQIAALQYVVDALSLGDAKNAVRLAG